MSLLLYTIFTYRFPLNAIKTSLFPVHKIFVPLLKKRILDKFSARVPFSTGCHGWVLDCAALYGLSFPHVQGSSASSRMFQCEIGKLSVQFVLTFCFSRIGTVRRFHTYVL